MTSQPSTGQETAPGQPATCRWCSSPLFDEGGVYVDNDGDGLCRESVDLCADESCDQEDNHPHEPAQTQAEGGRIEPSPAELLREWKDAGAWRGRPIQIIDDTGAEHRITDVTADPDGRPVLVIE